MRTAVQRKTDAGGISTELLHADRIIFVILVAHLPVIMFLAPAGYGTNAFAIYAAVLAGLLTIGGYLTLQGTPWFGRLAAVLFATLSAILVQAQLGRTEMHFHVFLALVVLFLYRDWTLIALAGAVVTFHHLVFTALQLHGVGLGEMPIMLYSYNCSWGIAFLHSAFVVAETLLLVHYARLASEDRHTAERISAALATLGHEKLGHPRISDADDNPTLTAFDTLIAGLARLTQDIAQSARDVRAVAVQLDTAAQDAERNGTARQDQTTRAATALQTMTRAIQEAATTSRASADLAVGADQRAQAGHDVFERAMRSTADLQRIMADAAAAVRQLESGTERIAPLAAAIQDVAEHADRLALSLAGEDGGECDPAALAAEVRAVALAAQESARSIQGLGQRLRGDAAGAAARVDQGRRKTSETSSDILQVGLALNEVLEAVARVADASERIATATEQQRDVTASVDAGILASADQDRNLVDQARAQRALATRLRQVAKSLDAGTALYRRWGQRPHLQPTAVRSGTGPGG